MLKSIPSRETVEGIGAALCTLGAVTSLIEYAQARTAFLGSELTNSSTFNPEVYQQASAAANDFASGHLLMGSIYAISAGYFAARLISGSSRKKQD